MKHAAIDCTPEVLAQLVSVLEDAGVRVVNTLDGNPYEVICRLVIEGDVLPDECSSDKPLHLVTATISRESYGKQHLNRVTEFRVGPPVSRFEAATFLLQAGVQSVNEIRQMEGLPPLQS